jgi:hypothetical protein
VLEFEGIKLEGLREGKGMGGGRCTSISRKFSGGP